MVRVTDVLSPATTPPTDPGASPQRRRPLAVTAMLAGAAAPAAVLAFCMAVGLVGWFATDSGTHGDTRDAIRAGVDAWLLAHGSRLALPVATVTVVPLGLTLLCVYACFRFGRWAGRTSADEGPRGTALAVVVMAGVYGVLATGTAVLASTSEAQPGLLRAFIGGMVVALIGGGLGIAVGSGWLGRARSRLPRTVTAVGVGAVSTVLLLYAAGAVLLAGALLSHFGTAANVLAGLRIDASGAALYTVVVVAVTPNAVLLSTCYLLGPGFAVGAGTVVSPSAVLLGPVPAFPLLAALPREGAPAWWATAFLAVPVLAGLGGAMLTARRLPVDRYESAVLRGLGGGAGAGVLLAVLTVVAGGAVGPGRMTDVGAPFLEVLVAGAVAMGLGGAVGGVLAAWWVRRR
jgi:hypothetical protein